MKISKFAKNPGKGSTIIKKNDKAVSLKKPKGKSVAIYKYMYFFSNLQSEVLLYILLDQLQAMFSLYVFNYTHNVLRYPLLKH